MTTGLPTNLPASTVADLWANLSASDICLASCQDVNSELAILMNLEPAALAQRRLLAVAWDQLGEPGEILSETIDQLAIAALSLWPEWYSPRVVQSAEATLHSLQEQAKTAGVERQVYLAWLEAADRACRGGRAPRWPGKFTAEVEARQLSLAVGNCGLVLAIRETEQSPAALLAFARSVEWLARELGSGILVLAPSALTGASQFDSINFHSVELGQPEPAITENTAANSMSATTIEAPSSVTPVVPIIAPQLSEPRATKKQRSKLLIHPLVGHPHPDSEGEQLLWEHLQKDSELQDLFLCNQWVVTEPGSRFLVDFVWEKGKLAVEVDGYYWHSSPHQFSLDRRRDYELQLTQFNVLRLPHDEVLFDVRSCLEKVRRLVRLQKRKDS